MTSVTLLDGIKSIASWTFQNCENLESVTIPKSVTKIGSGIFQYSVKLNGIIYAGTKADWENIQKNNDWDKYSGNYIIRCSDGFIYKAK